MYHQSKRRHISTDMHRGGQSVVAIRAAAYMRSVSQFPLVIRLETRHKDNERQCSIAIVSPSLFSKMYQLAAPPIHIIIL